MSDQSAPTTWRRLDAGEAAAILAVAQRPGWVAREPLEAAAALEEHLARLREEHAALVQIVQEARERGRHAGHEAGRAELAAIADSLRTFVTGIEQRAAVVAIAAAEALLHAEIAANPEQLVPRIRALLREQGAPVVRLRVAPAVCTALQGHADLGCAVVPDASLSPADAVLELPNGQVDARLHVALALLRPGVESALVDFAAREPSDG